MHNVSLLSSMHIHISLCQCICICICACICIFVCIKLKNPHLSVSVQFVHTFHNVSPLCSCECAPVDYADVKLEYIHTFMCTHLYVWDTGKVYMHVYICT
jgi:hypothetical protein